MRDGKGEGIGGWEEWWDEMQGRRKSKRGNSPRWPRRLTLPQSSACLSAGHLSRGRGDVARQNVKREKSAREKKRERERERMLQRKVEEDFSAAFTGFVQWIARSSARGFLSRLLPSSRLVLRHARLYHVQPERNRRRGRETQREMQGEAGAMLKGRGIDKFRSESSEDCRRRQSQKELMCKSTFKDSLSLSKKKIRERTNVAWHKNGTHKEETSSSIGLSCYCKNRADQYRRSYKKEKLNTSQWQPWYSKVREMYL